VLLREKVRQIGIAAAVAGLLATLALGCGGSSEAAPLKKPQFVKQANAVCVTTQAEREAQGKEIAKQGSSSEDPEAVMQQLLEPVEKMTQELGNLGPPKGDEKQVEAIIEAYEAAASKLEADPGGADSSSAFDQANKLAAAYGLTDCTI
jgi:hypothetical protein